MVPPPFTAAVRARTRAELDLAAAMDCRGRNIGIERGRVDRAAAVHGNGQLRLAGETLGRGDLAPAIDREDRVRWGSRR